MINAMVAKSQIIPKDLFKMAIVNAKTLVRTNHKMAILKILEDWIFVVVDCNVSVSETLDRR